MGQFFEELKRRNVFRVAVMYAMVSWLILQFTDVLSSLLQLPAWIGQLVVLLLAIGFVVAVVISWVYELTPEGIKLEKDVDRSQSTTGITGRKLDYAIIGVLAVIIAVLLVDRFRAPELDEPAVAMDAGMPTIAVLPFVNMSGDVEQEYFSDGLSEELLNLLAKIPQLQVTSRTSAFSYKGRDVTIQQVGEELGVGHVLEGSVRRSGDTIRITAQLIEVDTDSHLWSETWDRPFQDVFTIQEEIANSVARTLRRQLLGSVPSVQRTTAEVYELYLQSSNLYAQGNGASMRQAEPLLKRALELDPTYVPAWTSLSMVYFYGSGQGAWEPSISLPLARAAAEEAIRLDPNSVTAHAMLSNITLRYGLDMDRARSEMQRAMELGRNNPLPMGTAAFFALREGRLEEAIEISERAQSLDPLGQGTFVSEMAYFLVGREEEALRYSLERVDRAPTADRIHADLARLYLLMENYEEALAALTRENADGHQAAGRAIVYAAMGDSARARAELDRLLGMGERWTYELAEVYAYLGETDESFEWLTRAIDRSDPSLYDIYWNPFLENLRGDPRFDAAIERLGIATSN